MIASRHAADPRKYCFDFSLYWVYRKEVINHTIPSFGPKALFLWVRNNGERNSLCIVQDKENGREIKERELSGQWLTGVILHRPPPPQLLGCYSGRDMISCGRDHCRCVRSAAFDRGTLTSESRTFVGFANPSFCLLARSLFL